MTHMHTQMQHITYNEILVVSWCCTVAPNTISNTMKSYYILKYVGLRNFEKIIKEKCFLQEEKTNFLSIEPLTLTLPSKRLSN